MEPGEKTITAGTGFDSLCRWGGVSGFFGLSFISLPSCPPEALPLVIVSSGGGILCWAVSTGFRFCRRPGAYFWPIPLMLLLILSGFLGVLLLSCGLAGGPPLIHPSSR